MAFKLIESAQHRWRAVNAPHLVPLVQAGAVLVEAHDEWQVSDRRYLSEGSMALLNPTSDTGPVAALPAGD